MRNPDEPPIYATRMGSQGYRLLESPNKEHRVVVVLVAGVPTAACPVPSVVGAVLRRGPDVLATERQ